MDENIRFDEPEYMRSTALDKPSWLSSLVIKVGLAKDNAGAQKVLLVVLVLVVLATVIVLWVSNASSAPALSSQIIIKSEIPDNIKNEIPPAVFDSLPPEFYPKDLPQSTVNQLPSDLRQQFGI